MNQRSSTPPTPPEDSSSFPPKETALSSPDFSHEVSALAPDSTKDDKISLSTPSREITFYLEQMSRVPDVRQDKIAHFQKAIDSQNYGISAEKLVNSLLKELHPHPKETRPPTT